MTTTMKRLLVANRGEIARRVFATCRRLGIETVAVHSDADAGLPFVREADAAVRLPGNSPTETYLRADLVLEAARRTGADAIHPGYGFLSENADFARAVIAAGITWVGPAPESIEQMGSKIESKKLMEAAGVPVLTNHSVETATDKDLPLLVKASAGGGGRGMRVVRTLADLPTEIAAAEAEAESAFGDGTVFVEPYVEQGRHVEVQVLGHRDGVLVLGERDCSIQRRHQKVVEEAPAPNLADATRSALHEAARAAAAAIDYRGAGTVEFLYDAETERFFFLEMNTRLQVEHPVTELVHGVDLVEQQLAVAEGRRLDERVIGETYGHAIEVRLYAEDPAHDWQPQSGRADTLRGPGRLRRVRPAEPAGPAGGLRLRVGQRGLDALRRDARQGDRVGAHAHGGGAQAGRRALACPAARRGHQPRPARGEPARRGLLSRATSAPTSSTVAASCRAGDRLPPTRTCCSRQPSRWPSATGSQRRAGRAPGRLAQRRLPAAAHRVRRSATRSTSSSGTADATATPRDRAT